MKRFISILAISLLIVFSPLYSLSVKSCDGVEQVVDHYFYVLGYDEDTECPLYVEYVLSTDEVRELGSVKRSDSFREDEDVLTESASPKDYYKSGFDKGHLFPSYHGTFCKEADSLSFLMSNMTPQYHSMNAGAWKKLEMRVVDLAKMYGDVKRICGPIFDEPIKYIGKNRVGVPTRFFNIVSYIKDGEEVIECHIVTNGKTKDEVKVTKAKLETIERLTGITFSK